LHQKEFYSDVKKVLKNITKIEKVFGEKVVLINSTVSEAKKTKLWLDIYNNKTKIVV